MTALFIPLKREHFLDFQNGTKKTEYRPYGARWNERTCHAARPVTLSLGYGKANRLAGRITGFSKNTGPSSRPEWVAIYGAGVRDVACIEIEIIT